MPSKLLQSRQHDWFTVLFFAVDHTKRFSERLFSFYKKKRCSESLPSDSCCLQVLEVRVVLFQLRSGSEGLLCRLFFPVPHMIDTSELDFCV